MRRTLLAGALLVLGITLFLWSRRGAERQAPTSSSAADAATTSRSTRPARPAAPLRLPAATTHEDPRAATGEFGGRVVSSTDGKTIARAALTFLHEGAAISTETDATGRFHVAAASPGAYELTSAAATGFAPFEPQLGHSPVTVWARAGVRVEDVTIYLTPAIALTVIVQDDKGKPLPGAEVRVFDSARGGADVQPVPSDAKGEAHVSARLYDLAEARHAGYVAARALVSVAAQSSGELTLRLLAGSERPRLSIRGRVVDAHDQPIDGALVEAEPPSPKMGEQQPPGAQTLSSVDGGFTLGALDEGSYTLRASARGHAGVVRRTVPTGSHDVVLRLGDANAVLRGSVRDGSGKLLVAFSVVARMREGLLGRGPEERATVIDPQGHYELPLAPGKYEVAAAARGLARSEWQPVELGSGGATVDFTLHGGGRLFGRVVERGSNKPLGGANVVLEGDAIDDDITISSEAQSAGDGSFTLEGVAPGRHSINVQAANHNGRLVGALQLAPDGAIGPLTIDLAPVKPGEEPQTEFVGISAQLGADPAGMLINGVGPGGGAAEAGLMAGDVILAVDGQDVEALGFVGGIQLIRGPEDSIVNLTVKRKDGSVQVIPVRRKRVNF